MRRWGWVTKATERPALHGFYGNRAGTRTFLKRWLGDSPTARATHHADPAAGAGQHRVPRPWLHEAHVETALRKHQAPLAADQPTASPSQLGSKSRRQPVPARFPHSHLLRRRLTSVKGQLVLKSLSGKKQQPQGRQEQVTAVSTRQSSFLY